MTADRNTINLLGDSTMSTKIHPVADYIMAIRVAALRGTASLLKASPDYDTVEEHEAGRIVAREVLAGLNATVLVSFALPPAPFPVYINGAGYGLHEIAADPQDLMDCAIGDGAQLMPLIAVVLRDFHPRTWRGFEGLAKRYTTSDVVYTWTGDRLFVSFKLELDAD